MIFRYGCRGMPERSRKRGRRPSGCRDWRRSCRCGSRNRSPSGSPATAIRGPGRCPAGWQGSVATVEEFADSADAAHDLAGFLVALHAFDPGEIPPERQAELEQERLVDRDAQTREAIAEVGTTFDAAAMIMVWQAALDAPEPEAWHWVHGDFHTGNLLTDAGRVTTVIDFGGFTHGDPAFDLMMAYTLLSPRCRTIFRDAVGLDDATWARGRGWALCTGLNAYTTYAATHPRVAAQTTRQITQALLG